VTSSSSTRSGVWEWFWRGRALEEARGLEPEWQRQAGPERESLRRADLAAELAERALDPVDPLRAGSGAQLALSLQRQAIYWLLVARNGAAASSLGAAWDAAPAGLLLGVCGSEAELAHLRAILVGRSFIEDAGESTDRALEQGRLVQRFIRALLLALSPKRRAQHALWLRWSRSGSLALLVLALLTAGYVAYRRATQAEDLAHGKPWRASSKFADCQRETGACGGPRVLFHTLEEPEPWFEIDLGAAHSISVVEIENRQDCCAERAVPLVIEVSSDRTKWKAVARREDVFRSWTASIEPVTARYVRAKVRRKSTLHLERMTVRAY
jgi:hypothetical protein